MAGRWFVSSLACVALTVGCRMFASPPTPKPVETTQPAAPTQNVTKQPTPVPTEIHVQPQGEDTDSRWSETAPGESLETRYQTYVSDLVMAWEQSGYASVMAELPASYNEQASNKNVPTIIRNPQVDMASVSFDHLSARVPVRLEYQSQDQWVSATLIFYCEKDRVKEIIVQ